MEKRRGELSAGEVDALYTELGRRLDRMGLETQPRVAMRLLEIASDPDAGMADFSRAIAHDAMLTGRLLKMANSAFFAQREPVTSVDRACVLLGRERLKAVALGFYLSRAAATDGRGRISRRVWGQSVFRGCLAAELAKRIAPTLTSESFVIGLLLDAGMPLAADMLGEAYVELCEADAPPPKQFLEESRGFPFTHVDVVTALVRRWRLPELLAKPIEWHHIVPGESLASSPVTKLQRVAYYAGSIRLDAARHTPSESAPLRLVAERQLEMPIDELSRVIDGAKQEYTLSLAVFRDVGDEVSVVDQVAQMASAQLAEAMEHALSVRGTTNNLVQDSFEIEGLRVDVQIEGGSGGKAFVLSRDGQKLMATSFSPGPGAARNILSAFGFDRATPDAEKLRRFVEPAR